MSKLMDLIVIGSNQSWVAQPVIRLLLIYLGDAFTAIAVLASAWLFLKRQQQTTQRILQWFYDNESSKEASRVALNQTNENERQKIANAVARELEISATKIARDLEANAAKLARELESSATKIRSEVLSVAANVEHDQVATVAAVMKALQDAADARIKVQETLDKLVAATTAGGATDAH